MPLDALCLMPLTKELKSFAEGAKIDKIQQPGKNEVIFTLRGIGMSRRLLVSVASGRARAHFTEASYENPQQPPMFCMLLRKHLSGAKIASVVQPSMERIISIELDVYDEMGVPGKNTLIIELMGVSANLILLSGEGRIIDALRRVEGDLCEKRSVIPGLFYRPPQPVEKKDPMLISKEEFARLWSEAYSEKTVDSWLLDTFFGFSPLLSRELSLKFFGDTSLQISCLSPQQRASFPEEYEAFINSLKEGSFTPYMLKNAEKPYDFYCIPITQYGSKMEAQTFSGFSVMLDFFYTERDLSESAKQRTQTLVKAVKNLRDRLKRKLTNQNEELKATFGRERLREIGDIITANIHNMKQGMAVLHASDFYTEENASVEIKLDSRLSPQQNAAKYYKDYNKSKKAEKHLTEQIKTGETELYYLESVLDELSRVEGEKEVLEIRKELEKMGILSSKSYKKKEKEIKSKPLRFVSSSGFNILVGKNNTQNDELTFRTADRFDIWLHTQKIHGSHAVILTEGKKADESTIEEAAMLAAHYSQSSNGQKIPVDYTLIKFVKKPQGAKPGMVIYTDYKTVFVTPDKKLIEKLQIR